ncbi:hypothetical protein [Paenibacillus harenae]|uniref:hypothetical protein n=1 Tax=Paenibacillus harenae TaxID=306543 RepID=UPI00048D95AE|nr:hypothetical protein [Paenibacillus harenae]
MKEKKAFTVLINSKTSKPAKLFIPNHLVAFPEDLDEDEYMYLIAEDQEGNVEFLYSNDVICITSTDPDDPKSCTFHGECWPVHTVKATQEMAGLMEKFLVLDGG